MSLQVSRSSNLLFVILHERLNFEIGQLLNALAVPLYWCRVEKSAEKAAPKCDAKSDAKCDAKSDVKSVRVDDESVASSDLEGALRECPRFDSVQEMMEFKGCS